MAAPANSVESEMATEYYYEQCRVFPDFPPSPPRLPFPLSPPQLPFSPWLPQNQEHDDILVHPDASTVTPPYVAGGSDPSFLTICQEVIPDFCPLPTWPSPAPLSPSLPQNQELVNSLVVDEEFYKNLEQQQEEFNKNLKNLEQEQEEFYKNLKNLEQEQEEFDKNLKNLEQEQEEFYKNLKNLEQEEEFYKNLVQEQEQFRRLYSLSPPSLPPSLPQNQEHDDILVHPDTSTVTPKRKRKQRSRKNNGRTSSGVGSDDKFNQGVDESVDGRTIGKLFVSNREIAKGSNGTIVLEGTHEVRPVAVKRLVKAYHDVAYKEYKNLCLSDRHPNIVRLYGVEEDQYFVYLALERCTCSLNDLIQMQLLDAPTTSGDQATEVNIEYKVRLQSMKGTLPGVKLWEDNGYPSPTLWKLMRDMVYGLVHLHELRMVRLEASKCVDS